MKVFRLLLTLLLLSSVLVACGRRVSDAELYGRPVVAAPEREDTSADEADEVDADPAPLESDEESSAETETDQSEPEGEVVAPEPEPENAAEVVLDEIILDIRAADPANGQILFNMPTSAGFACSNCHVADSEQRLVGPGMYGLPQRAPQRIADAVPERYLYNSIVHPNDYIVEDYPESVMPLVYTDIFSEDELHDLVAYLMTLDDPSLVTPEPPAEIAEAEQPAEAEANTESEAEAETVTEADAEPADSAPAATPEPIIIIVTATPSVPEVAAAENAAIPTPISDPDAEPDIVVTLVNLGLTSFGERIFASECASCHSLDTAEVVDGNPGLANVAGRVLNSGIIAERYLYNIVVEGHADLGVNYDLNDAQLLDIVAYLMTLNDN